MAIMKQHVSTAVNFANSSFLNSSSNVSARSIGVVDMSADDYPNAKLRMTLNLSTATVEGGAVEVYFLASLDNSVWTDNITPSSSADHTAKLKTAQRIAEFQTGVTTADINLNWVCNDLQRLVGDLPPYWSLCINNVSGSTLEASGHTIQYHTVSYKGTT